MLVRFIGLTLRRIANTWNLMKQSFVVIRGHPPLLLLPVASAVFCLLISISTLGGGVLIFHIRLRSEDFAPAVPKASVESARELMLAAIDQLLGNTDIGESIAPRTASEKKDAEHVWLVLFFFYVANYVVITYFNVAFAHVALNRLMGGTATLDDGLKIAWARKHAVLQWAVLASTVGILLKWVSDRSTLGKFIASILGYVWRLATYLVMPMLALEDLSAGEALYSSASLLKRTWGEVLIAGFSFPLLFWILASPGIALFFLGGFMGQSIGLAAVVVLAYWLLLAVIVSSAEQTFTAALYLYARDRKTIGFSKNDLKKAWEGLEPLPIGQAL